MRGRHLAALLVVAGALLAGLSSPGAANHPAEIAFTSIYGGGTSLPGTNVLAIRPDGGGRRVIVSDATDPRWAPDGSRLVYTSLQHGDNGSVGPAGLFVVAADGGQPIQITTGDDSAVGWSRDGAWIAFVRYQSGTEDLYVVAPDGTGEQPLVRGITDAQWAPDSKHLVVTRRSRLLLIDLTGLGRLLPNTRCSGEGSISPDGKWVAFAHCLNRSADGIAAERLDGSRFHWLAKPIKAFSDDNPVWSPDGKNIAYVQERFVGDLDHSEIRVVSAAGKSLVRLASSDGDHDEYPQWSPNGRQIVFDRDSALEPIGEDVWLQVGDVNTGRVRFLYQYIDRGTEFWRPR